jgi:putative ABC transport system substrate-binding protein
MRRREFITLLGSATTMTSLSWSPAARAQQVGTRRIGVLMGFPEADPAARALLAEFIRALTEHGWTEGGNVRIDVRWASGTIDQMRVFARELVDLKPDVILSNTTVATAALKYETQTIPIVFVVVADPIGSGLVTSLPRPGGHITGFSPLEASMPGKWLELLKEIAPGLKRVAMVFNPDTAPFVTSFFQPPFEAAAQSLGLATQVAPVHSEAELETVITALGRDGGGLLAMPDNFNDIHHVAIIAFAARNKVPAIYQTPVSARDGGLLSYGADFQDMFRRSARYVDNILRGAKPSELPVQMPVKYLLIINLKTAKALGLTVPQSILLIADEVIE